MQQWTHLSMQIIILPDAISHFFLSWSIIVFSSQVPTHLLNSGSKACQRPQTESALVDYRTRDPWIVTISCSSQNVQCIYPSMVSNLDELLNSDSTSYQIIKKIRDHLHTKMAKSILIMTGHPTTAAWWWRHWLCNGQTIYTCSWVPILYIFSHTKK